MQAPKSPEKQTRLRKTEKVKKPASVGTTKPGRLSVPRDQKKTETKSKTPKKQKQEQFYDIEDSEDFLYEDKAYEENDPVSTMSDLLQIEPTNRTRVKKSESFQDNTEKGSKNASYPDLINKMLVLCVNEKDFIKGTCAGRIKSHYQKVFQTYKDKMEPRDRAIVNSGLNYIYNFNRSNSIPKENAIWLISIHDIPVSHIVSYTSKNTLKEIAKEYGISCSNKKSEDLVVNIREAIEKN